MKKAVITYFLNPWYAVTSLITVAMVFVVTLITNNLPQFDETSFLSPILNRFDFLNIEDVSLDAVFAMKDTHDSDPRLIVVNIEQVNPAPDGQIAMLLYKLQQYGAKAIGIDVIFDSTHFERFSIEGREGEPDAIRQALRDVPDVVLVRGFDEESLEPAWTIDPAIAASHKYYGFANLLPDDDGVVRRFRPQMTIDDERWISFPLQVARLYDSTLTSAILDRGNESEIIYYTGTYSQFQTLPISDILNADSSIEPQLAAQFKDAIVLVGFVQEAGLSYLGDMHRTPMAHRTTYTTQDGTELTGVEGPDMPGILIHANVINMLLKGDYVSPVPAWLDWFIVFLLTFLNAAFYRVVTGMPVTTGKHGLLVAGILIVESPIVFFIPVVAFFYFGVKISYHLMATAVVLFIPANVWSGKLRYVLKKKKAERVAGADCVIAGPSVDAIGEMDDMMGVSSLVHASLYLTHFCMSVESASQVHRGEAVNPGLRMPGLDTARSMVRSIDKVFDLRDAASIREQEYLRHVFGKKDQHLRDSFMKDMLISRVRDDINPHAYSAEHEALAEGLMDLLRRLRRPYLDTSRLSIPTGDAVDPVTFMLENELIDLTPFIVQAECKLHREQELFVFAGIVPRQFGIDALPMYFGPTQACEAALAPGCTDRIRNLFGDLVVQ
jgi:CHASE2 domain-containing sensor protein